MLESIIIIIVFMIPLLLMLMVKPACGAYDPVDYKCGKCDICKREDARR